MRVALLGFDPGIRDTGAVALTLDLDEKTIDVLAQVWSGVTHRHGFNVTTDEKFLDEAAALQQSLRQRSNVVLTGIEGYRQRGMNVQQDQEMLNVIQDLRATLPGSVIVDNTGIKKVVTEPMLKLFHVARFKRGTNHADLKSAARVALKRGIDQDECNPLLADYIIECVNHNGGQGWSLGSIQTL